ncbi:protein EARLY RESPONSIVE TO DEHYDRATION 15-like [Silene latifolia]|uniref:protein EARLY RESPONSIVE TO DEHYDRATION 15-like n=1 Tax=Silene latifolia TaxID=37657 RepID=UPI003D779FCB
MALVSGVRSTLNPNAPVYIPAAFRQVEEFSPEWYDLINSSMWFRDYWLTQHQETETLYGSNQNNFVGNDVVDLLPDEIDLGVDEDLLTMESQFEEFLKFSGSQLQESKLLPKEVIATTGSKTGFERQEKPVYK